MNASDIAQTLKDNGQPITLTRTTPGTFDPVTGDPGISIVQTWQIYGIMTNFSTLARYGGTNNNPQTLVLSGDKQAKLSAGVVVPLPGDVLYVNGDNWTIIALDSLAPVGVDLMYSCHVRT